ncbi:MAG: ISAs1 family transposase [Chloroflexota bacterium]|nr:ISAs1 family transposase [Chloroflexota bacterium]
MEASTGAGSREARVFDVGGLWERLATLADARHARGKRYPLALVLLLMVLAKLGGEDRPSGIAEWVAHRRDALQAALGVRWARMPHHNTYRRVLAQAVEPGELDAAVGAFLTSQPGVGRSVLVSIDGKTVRGTIDTPATRGEHLLAAYLPAEGIVLLQVAAGDKENEISVAPTLLRALDLRGKVVAGDALHTQRALSAQILAAGGAYLWVAKANQPTLRADIETLFTSDDHTVAGGRIHHDFRTARTVDHGHGRSDIRTLIASSDLHGFSDWPGLHQVFRLERQRVQIKSGKREHEVSYGLTSLSPAAASAAQLLALTRAHWGIENGLHHCRDVTFREDATRLTQGQAGRVMAALNNLVIGLLRCAGHTNLAAARRLYNANLLAAFALLAPPSRL